MVGAQEDVDVLPPRTIKMLQQWLYSVLNIANPTRIEEHFKNAQTILPESLAQDLDKFDQVIMKKLLLIIQSKHQQDSSHDAQKLIKVALEEYKAELSRVSNTSQRRRSVSRVNFFVTTPNREMVDPNSFKGPPLDLSTLIDKDPLASYSSGERSSNRTQTPSSAISFKSGAEPFATPKKEDSTFTIQLYTNCEQVKKWFRDTMASIKDKEITMINIPVKFDRKLYTLAFHLEETALIPDAIFALVEVDEPFNKIMDKLISIKKGIKIAFVATTYISDKKIVNYRSEMKKHRIEAVFYQLDFGPGQQPPFTLQKIIETLPSLILSNDQSQAEKPGCSQM